MRAVILQPRTVPNSCSSPRKVAKTAKMPKTAKTDTLLIHKFAFCGNVRNRIPKIFELAKTSYLCGQFKKNHRCKLHRDHGKLCGVMRLSDFPIHFSCSVFVYRFLRYLPAPRHYFERSRSRQPSGAERTTGT